MTFAEIARAAALRAKARREPPTAKKKVWGVRPPVEMSEDLARILALPRRELTPVDVTAEYEKKGNRIRLRPVQSLALAEAKRAGGLIAPIGVGEGKTLITLLLPVALGVRNSVLLVPPQLKDQLLNRDYPQWVKHFRIPNIDGPGMLSFPNAPGLIQVVAYSELSSASKFDILDRIKPELIVADEAHSLRHKDAARSRRFLGYFKRHPQTKFCALSGTLTTRSLHDYAHLCTLALRKGSPLPLSWPTLEEWSAALDVSDFPADPGELRRLCNPGETPREGFRRRFVQTPGVVATSVGHVASSLVLHRRGLVPDRATEDALKGLRDTWCTPGGEELMDALSMSRIARQLACGVFLRWIYPRGEPEKLRKRWLEARAEWHKEVRDFLKHRARPGVDSPLLVEQAVVSGQVASMAWEPWLEVRDLVQPETEAVWVSEYLARDAVEWAKKNTGIIWYSTTAVGMKIAKLGGFPFFGAGEASSAGIALEDGSRTVVASIKAQGTGLNLQAWSNQLITSFPSNGSTAEQLLGRTHRTGQAADEVEAWVYAHTKEMQDAFLQARQDARYQAETLGHPQRLLYCSYSFDPEQPEQESAPSRIAM